MARRWTPEEETHYRKQLQKLYVTENRTICEIGNILSISEQTVFQRLKRLGIPTAPERKSKYRNKRNDVKLPLRSKQLAEFVGIMLGDGHISHFQTLVTLGTKEYPYVRYVQKLMRALFNVPATVSRKKSGYHDVYIGSTKITSWLKDMGLVSHKVREQVDVPKWIFSSTAYTNAFVRGFFDTDGSVYSLRYGIQLSFTNHSVPLLLSLRRALVELGYKPSAVSGPAVYLTKRSEIERFFSEVRPANAKHQRRQKEMWRNLTRR